jgi:ABC-2 type transport system ATP-binding protein
MEKLTPTVNGTPTPDSFARPAQSPRVADFPPLPDAAPPASYLNPGTTLLEVEHATVRFDRFTAVKDVSFALQAGSLLGLIGPNGAGKTTLLRAIALLQNLHRGTIRILGDPVKAGDEEAARMLGFTPDVPPAYEALTVRQFLEFIAAGYGLAPENTRPTIDHWLEKVWLSDKAGQKVKSLTRGMKQRLGIARTMLPNPQVILLDEPAAGLDPAGRVQFRKLLTDLRDQGKTLIVSSHILSDMEEYCTHVAIMSAGSLVQFGTVHAISSGANDGRCRYTVDLAAPVARLQALIEEIEGVSHVQVDRLQIVLEYWSERHRAAELLKALMDRQVPVAGFAANPAGLEEAYLRAGIRQVD